MGFRGGGVKGAKLQHEGNVVKFSQVILEDGVAYSVRWPLENRVFATVGRSLGVPYFVW